jgi:hypothetical protein
MRLRPSSFCEYFAIEYLSLAQNHYHQPLACQGCFESQECILRKSSHWTEFEEPGHPDWF